MNSHYIPNVFAITSNRSEPKNVSTWPLPAVCFRSTIMKGKPKAPSLTASEVVDFKAFFTSSDSIS